MKNHRFPWLRNRTTDNRKCEKARNIKEKRTIEMFNTVSKQPVVLLSSPSVNFGVSVWFTPVCPCKKFTGPFGKIFPEGLFGSLFFHIIRTGMAEPSGSGIPIRLWICNLPITVPRIWYRV